MDFAESTVKVQSGIKTIDLKTFLNIIDLYASAPQIKRIKTLIK